MFNNAKIKLTIWYVVIIAVISAVPSILFYRSVSFELDRGLRHRGPFIQIQSPRQIEVDLEIIEEIKKNILVKLLIINLSVISFSGIASYFLAGVTLKPIEEMMEDQKRFVSDASHELRTPLTVLKSEIEVGLRDKKITLTDAKKMLESNLDEVNKIQTLTNHLLSLNKYQNLKNKRDFETLNIKELIQMSTQNMTSLFNSKDIKLINKTDSINIYGHKKSIEELFTIILDNAIKYSDVGGKIKISSKKDSKYCYVSIKDNGIGIKSSEIPHIFNRFFRASSSRSKTEVDGYGLGLSIAKNIIDLHGGKIIVDSLIGEGTTFTIKLPLRKIS